METACKKNANNQHHMKVTEYTNVKGGDVKTGWKSTNSETIDRSTRNDVYIKKV
jgi:hypothetical protein